MPYKINSVYRAVHVCLFVCLFVFIKWHTEKQKLRNTNQKWPFPCERIGEMRTFLCLFMRVCRTRENSAKIAEEKNWWNVDRVRVVAFRGKTTLTCHTYQTEWFSNIWATFSGSALFSSTHLIFSTIFSLLFCTSSYYTSWLAFENCLILMLMLKHSISFVKCICVHSLRGSAVAAASMSMWFFYNDTIVNTTHRLIAMMRFIIVHTIRWHIESTQPTSETAISTAVVVTVKPKRREEKINNRVSM